MTFNAADASVEGFRVMHRKPMVLVWWGLTYLAMALALVVIVGAPFWALMQRFEAMSDRSPTEAEVFGMMGSYGLILLLALPIIIAFSAILAAAVSRAVLKPEDSRLGYLRLGADEWRVGVVMLVLTVLLMVAYVVAGGAVFILAGAGNAANTGMGVLLGILGGLAALAFIIWVAIKFSLAIPITFAEKRIAIFDSFNVTRGHFWGLLGMSVIAVIISFVIGFIGSIITTPFQLMVGPAMQNTAATGNMAQMFAAMGPLIAVSAVVQLVISTVQLPVMYAPFSAAYRGIKGPLVDDISKTFE